MYMYLPHQQHDLYIHTYRYNTDIPPATYRVQIARTLDSMRTSLKAKQKFGMLYEPLLNIEVNQVYLE